jgi:hypothetical protein
LEIGLGVLGAVSDLAVSEGIADRSSRTARERSCFGARRIFFDTKYVSYIPHLKTDMGLTLNITDCINFE